MDYLQCSDMVREIIGNIETVRQFYSEEIRTWRRLQVKRILPFSLRLANDFYEKFRNVSEATVLKDDFYTNWGSVTIETSGRPPWYYPYMIIDLVMFNANFDYMFKELRRKDDFITIGAFIDAAVRLGYSLSVDFEPEEIGVLKTIFAKRGSSKIGIISFNELATHIRTKTWSAKYYWEILNKFFHPSIVIDHGKLGLFPVLIKHKRELTDLEKQYTLYSFHNNGYYFTLIFIPKESSWLETNESGGEGFEILDFIERLDHGWNLTHFTEKASERWGYYPGLHRKDVIEVTRDEIIYNRNQHSVKGVHARDFEILASLNRGLGRMSDAAAQLGIHVSHFNRRITFLKENEVFYPKVSFHRCGLDIEQFLIFYARNLGGKQIISRIKTSLAYFPYAIMYSGKNSLMARIQMPSRWLRDFSIELAELVAPGGAWEGQVEVSTGPSWVRNTIRNKLSDLHKLVVITTEETGQQLSYTWTFELPRYKR
ncbi:MAG: hypothetical protein ACFFD4_18160 [Candidatus Odinarchaeota archaeon]